MDRFASRPGYARAPSSNVRPAGDRLSSATKNATGLAVGGLLRRVDGVTYVVCQVRLASSNLWLIKLVSLSRAEIVFTGASASSVLVRVQLVFLAEND